MNKVFLAVLAVLLACAPVQAAGSRMETARRAVWTWFKHLKKGLTHSSNQGFYRRARVTAVAAVRGAEQVSFDPETPTWKGGLKARKAARLKEEKAQFESAVDLILAGKLDEGLAALRGFEEANPKSRLLPEVKEAQARIAKLQESRREAERRTEESNQLSP